MEPPVQWAQRKQQELQQVLRQAWPELPERKGPQEQRELKVLRELTGPSALTWERERPCLQPQ